jgi:hypothetical protein
MGDEKDFLIPRVGPTYPALPMSIEELINFSDGPSI